MDMDMDSGELTRKVLAAVRGNDALTQEISSALLSRDPAKVRQALRNMGIDASDAEVDQAINEFGTEEKIAANT